MKRPRDVRRMFTTNQQMVGDTDDFSFKCWPGPKGDWPKTIERVPVAVVDLRPEAQERLEHMLINSIGAWESNKYGQRTSLGNRASQARAVLAALFGANKRKQ